jgi:60S ribosomal subunit assembly/export protein LOC1
MAPSRTKTVKSKHAANKSGIKNSKNSTKPQNDGVSKSKKPPKSRAPPHRSSGGQVKKKRKIYTEEELGIPTLNMITPVGVEKPKGKKKGKVFVDDKVYTIHPMIPPSTKSLMTAFELTNTQGIHDDDPSHGKCR